MPGGRGSVALSVALERQGLDAPAAEDNAVLSYASGQVTNERMSLKNEPLTTNGIEKGLDELERYNRLRNTEITIPDATGKLDYETISQFNRNGYKKASEPMAALARRYGLISNKNQEAKRLTNKYLPGMVVEFSKTNLDESISKQKDGMGNLAALMPVFENTYKNAVPVLNQGNRYLYTSQDASDTKGMLYLLGGFTYGDSIVPVQFELKRDTNKESNRIYVVATIKKDAVTVREPAEATPRALASSTHSIEELIQNVNSDETKILANIPAYFLNEEQKAGKRKGQAEKGNTIREKAEAAGKDVSAPVNMTTERIDTEIKNNGAKFSPNYSQAYMAYIRPDDFLRLTASNTQRYYDESRVLVASELRENKETPFLKFDQDTGHVTGHEGRHRMAALANAGVQKVAILLKPNGSEGRYDRKTIGALQLNANNNKVTMENLIPVNETHRQELIDAYGESKNWFQYSLKSEQYMQAAESGDTETAQRLVDEAARDAGYTIKVFHGTPNSGFTQFRDWSFFTENKKYADLYQRPTYTSGRGLTGNETPGTYELYLNLGNVFDTRDEEAADLYEQIRQEAGMGELGERGLPDWNDAPDLIDYFEENDLPYDTILLDEGGTMGQGEKAIERGISYASKGTQVKSAAPVTYDDDGKIIPLDERFQRNNGDIRFSLRSDANLDAESVRGDADLYAQVQQDRDARR